MRTPACVILTLALTRCVSPAVAASEAVLVEMSEFAFRPAVIHLRVGRPVALRFVNRGQIAHQFEADSLRDLSVIVNDVSLRVETRGLDILRLQPGATATVQFVPRRAGRFLFACTIEGHREAGMQGVLQVY